MTRRDRRSLVLTTALAGALGCGTGDDDATSIPITDAGTKPDALDATAKGDGAGLMVATGPTAYLRIADWSPDAPPVDFCLAAPDSGAYYGPLLGTAFVTDGSAPAIAFPNASAYMGVPAGSFDARIVPAGATGCTAGLGGEVHGVALPANGYTTLGLAGRTASGAQGLRGVWFADDSRSAGGKTAVRFIQAEPLIGRATFAFSSSPQLAPFFSETAPYAGLGAGSDAGVDNGGYANIAPLSAATLAVTVDAGDASTNVATATVSAAAGSVLSFVLVAVPGADSGPPVPAILECVDNAGTAGLYSDCNLVF
jgi:Domain of unknown function (DUF4397)